MTGSTCGAKATERELRLKVEQWRRTIFTSASYIGTVLSSQLFSVVKSVITPVIFGPSQLAVWSISNVILGYGANAHLGVLHGMNRLYPIANARSDLVATSKIQGNSYLLNLIFNAMVALGLLLSSPFLRPELKWPICILAFVNFTQGLFTYYTCILRSTKNFGAVGVSLMIFSLISTATLSLSWFVHQRLYLAMFGLGIAFAGAVAYQRIKAPQVTSWRLDRAVVRDLFSVGLPMAGTVMIDTLFLSVDRWVLLSAVTATEIGYYALPLMCASFLSNIPSTLANMLFPRFLEGFAGERSVLAPSELFDTSFVLMSYIHLLIIFCCSLALPPIIVLFVPKYIPALPYFYWLIPAGYLYSLAAIPGVFLVAIDKFRYLGLVDGLLLLINLILALSLSHLGVHGVAMSTSIAYALFGLTYVVLAYHYALRTKRQLLLLIFRAGVPFAVCLVIIASTRQLLSLDSAEVMGGAYMWRLLCSLLGGVAALVCSMALTSWDLVKSHQLLSIIKLTKRAGP